MNRIVFITQIIIVAAMLFLSACSPLSQPPTFAPTVQLAVPPTFIPTPSPTTTETSLPTATPTTPPTATATLAPTEDFSDLSVCRTWMDALKQCPVTLNDLKSGKLVDFAKKVMKPLSPDAYQVYAVKDAGVTERNMYHTAVEYAIDFLPLTDGLDEKTKKWMSYGDGIHGINNALFSSPLSPIGDQLLFLIKGEKGSTELPFDTLVMVVELKTRSGKMGYYTLVYPSCIWGGDKFTVEKSITLARYHNWVDLMAYHPPTYNPGDIACYENSEPYCKFSSFFNEVIKDPYGQRKKLLDEWIETGDIPAELEKIPLYPFINPDRGWPWSIKLIPQNAYPKGSHTSVTPTFIQTHEP